MTALEDLLDRPVWEAAPALLGWTLATTIAGERTSVRLTEVEAYDQTEPAAHTFRGPTPRTAAMFGPPGHLYVYRSYGIHWCANVTAGPRGHGAGILLRGGDPLEGLETMTRRRGRQDHLADGPGKLAQALAIDAALYGADLADLGGLVMLESGIAPGQIHASPRIGISRATNLPWRFVGHG